MPFDAERMKGVKATVDLVDADTGEVVRRGRQEADRARARASSPRRASRPCARRTRTCYGQYIAEDLYNPQTGEIFAEAGDEITAKSLAALIEAGFDELPILDIDHINIGPYIRNTLAVDKNSIARRRAVRHLPRHASGRAADDRHARRRCSTRCSSIRSATTSRPSAASR